MNERVKQRVIGAIVLCSLAIIFVPLTLDLQYQPEAYTYTAPIPPLPDKFKSLTLPLDAPTSIKSSTHDTPLNIQNNPNAKNSKSPTTLAKTENNQSNSVLPRAWIIQLGSFSEEKNALALQMRLQKQGFHAFVEDESDQQVRSFRVRIGPEVTRAGADAVKNKLQKQLNLQAVVMAYYFR